MISSLQLRDGYTKKGVFLQLSSLKRGPGLIVPALGGFGWNSSIWGVMHLLNTLDTQ